MWRFVSQSFIDLIVRSTLDIRGSLFPIFLKLIHLPAGRKDNKALNLRYLTKYSLHFEFEALLSGLFICPNFWQGPKLFRRVSRGLLNCSPGCWDHCLISFDQRNCRTPHTSTAFLSYTKCSSFRYCNTKSWCVHESKWVQNLRRTSCPISG